MQQKAVHTSENEKSVHSYLCWPSFCTHILNVKMSMHAEGNSCVNVHLCAGESGGGGEIADGVSSMFRSKMLVH